MPSWAIYGNEYARGPVVPGTAVWTPAQLSGIVAWWDADLGVALSGSNVTSWTDQGPSAYVLGLNTSYDSVSPASPTFSATSYNGKAGITCASSGSHYLATTVSLSLSLANSSWFIAAQFSSASNSFGRLMGLGKGDGVADFNGLNGIAMLRDSTNQNVAFYHNNSESNVASMTYDTPTRFGWVFDGVNGTVYINNVQGAQSAMSDTLGGASSCQFAIAQAVDPGSHGNANLDGIIRRLLFTSSAVSSADRTNIDTWLQG